MIVGRDAQGEPNSSSPLVTVRSPQMTRAIPLTPRSDHFRTNSPTVRDLLYGHQHYATTLPRICKRECRMLTCELVPVASVEEALSRVECIDLSPICRKLHISDPASWPEEKIDEA